MCAIRCLIVVSGNICQSSIFVRKRLLTDRFDYVYLSWDNQFFRDYCMKSR